MEQKNIKKNLSKIVIIVLSVLILLVIVAVSILYFIFKNKDIREVANEPTEENMYAFEVPVITEIKYRKIAEGEASNFIQENNEENKEENEETKNENRDNKKKTKETKNENKDSKKETKEIKNENKDNKKEMKEIKKENVTTTNKKEATYNKNNTMKVEAPENKSNITTQKPKLISTDTQKKLTNTETKYGVVINRYTTITYNIYSDGSKTIKSTKNSTEYDRSRYNATTEELLPEAKATRRKHASKISKIIQNTNSYRQEANVNAVENITNRVNLNLNEQLCVAACVRAVEMAYANKYSHTRPNGSRCFTVASEMKISALAENIVYGYDSEDTVSLCWKYSLGHYKNMINNRFTEIGIGVFELDGVYYWVQLFA